MPTFNNTYHRKLEKPLSVDTLQMRAAVNLVLSVDAGKLPDTKSLEVLRDAFYEIFGGVPPQSIFGKNLGLVPVPGKPKDYGFTQADIISAYIIIYQRNNPGENLTRAKEQAIKAFNLPTENGNEIRIVDRYWADGKEALSHLTTEDLELIIEPYKK